MPTGPESAARPFEALGFTPLEALIYTELLRRPPTTGYQLAKAIGKPVANTYKALDSLRRRGAVLTNATDASLCRAEAVERVLGAAEREFRSHQARARSAVRALKAPAHDSEVYRMESAAQVIAHARRMLATAKSVVLLDVFPAPLALLRDDIVAAAVRGVRVAVLAYVASELPGVHVTLHRRADDVVAQWPGAWLRLVADGRVFLDALLAPHGDEVVQCLWSESVFLALLHESGLYAELLASQLARLADDGATAAEFRQTVKRMELYRNAAGVDSRAIARRPRVARTRQP